jgi:hypothetical protein
MPTTELMPRLPREMIGGARVFRACKINGVKRRRGDTLDDGTIAGIPRATLNALQDQRFIVTWPKNPTAEPGEVYVYNRIGTSTYDVVVGRKLNAAPLSKADAEALATQHRKPEAA